MALKFPRTKSQVVLLMSAIINTARAGMVDTMVTDEADQGHLLTLDRLASTHHTHQRRMTEGTTNVIPMGDPTAVRNIKNTTKKRKSDTGGTKVMTMMLQITFFAICLIYCTLIADIGNPN